MKNKERYKTQKVTDTTLTSSIEHDIKTRFGNDDTKNCISNSNPKPTEPHFSEKCLSPRPEALFHSRKCTWVAAQGSQTCLIACLFWQIRRFVLSDAHSFEHNGSQNHRFDRIVISSLLHWWSESWCRSCCLMWGSYRWFFACFRFLSFPNVNKLFQLYGICIKGAL